MTTATTSALHALLEGLIDYAGLFPPAGLPMEAAVENYARYKTGAQAWMLGRFIVPIARLAEFGEAWQAVGGPSGWHLSALIAKPDEELPAVRAFNAIRGSKVKIDALEFKATSITDIASLKGKLPADALGYVEIPVAQDPAPLIAAIRTAGLRAKIRTGGLTAEMFPDAERIARFLHGCSEAGVAFKATAGLHHPVRCVKPFTYEPDSPSGTMQGFLNVFLAAGYACKGLPVDAIEDVLREEDAAAFEFGGEGVRWRGEMLTTEELGITRKEFAIAFGSCSFEEPIADLQDIGLLP